MIPSIFSADLMDNDAIEGLLSYEPPWRSQLVKWREKRKTLLSSVASAAASLEVEPGQDIGGECVCVCVCVCVLIFLKYLHSCLHC